MGNGKRSILIALFVLICVTSVFSACKQCLFHKYGDWTVYKAPTCVEDGVERIVCTKCGKEKERRAIPKKGHTLVHEEGKDADCVSSGYKPYDHCSVCDYTTYEEIPAKGHSYGEWKFAVGDDGREKKPTCTEDGESVRTCGECGYVDRKTETKLGHLFDKVLVEAKAPTHDEKGRTESLGCSREGCGAVRSESKEIEQLRYIAFYAEYGEGSFVVSGATFVDSVNIPESANFVGIISGLEKDKLFVYEASIGAAVKVTASAGSGFGFVGWFKGDRLVENSAALSFDMTENDGVLYARFAGSVVYAEKSDVWDGSTASSFAGGSGTASDPFVIATGAQLKYLQANSSYYSKAFKLGADIDLAGREWQSIGTISNTFTGTFDGAGHVICNVKYVANGNYYSLFGKVSGNAMIINIGVENFSVSAEGKDYTYIGGLVAYMDNGGTIKNCYSKGNISVKVASGKTLYVGGFIGLQSIGNSSAAKIETSYADVEINVTVGKCTNVSVGGIVGSANGNYVQCIAFGSVKADAPNYSAGRLFGTFSGNADGCVYSSEQTVEGNVAENGNMVEDDKLHGREYYAYKARNWNSGAWNLDDAELKNGIKLAREKRSPEKNIEYFVVKAKVADGGSVSASDMMVESGATVKFIASANDGYRFLGWYDGDTLLSENETYEFKPDGSTEIFAAFEEITYFAVAKSNVDGYVPEVSPEGQVNGEYRPGENVRFVARELDGYVFVGWFETDADGSDPAYSALEFEIVIDRDLSFVAVYRKISTLKVEADEFGSARIGVDGDATETTATEGDSYKLVASANDGYAFFGWFDGNVLLSLDAEFDYVMQRGEKTVAARFTPSSYAYDEEKYIVGEKYFFVSVRADGKGTAFILDGENKLSFAVCGETVVIGTDNEIGYRLSGWYLGSELVEVGKNGEFKPEKDCELVAKIEHLEYKLTLSSDEDFDLFVEDGRDGYFYGDTAVVYAEKRDDFAFDGWMNEDGSRIDFTPEEVEINGKIYFRTEFAMPDADIVLFAVYKPLYTLTAESADERVGRVTGGEGGLLGGEEINLAAYPADGYEFFGWFVGDEFVDGNEFITVTMPKSDLVITARFKKKVEVKPWDGSTASSFAGGSGTASDPFVIATGAQLKYLQANSSYYSKAFKLGADIDLGGRDWQAIGNISKLFTGTFDGAGHVIRNVRYVANGNYYALFGKVSGSVINLGVENFSVVFFETPHSYVGGMVAFGSNSAAFLNCYAKGTVEMRVNGKKTFYVGGLIGLNEGESSIVSNCYSDVDMNVAAISVTGNSAAGGVVGKSAGTVTGCVAFGSMSASGFKSSGRVLGSGNGTDCYYNSDAESNVTAKSFETAKTEEDLTAASFYSSIGFNGTVWNLSADLAAGKTPELKAGGQLGKGDKYYQFVAKVEGVGTIGEFNALSDGTETVKLTATPGEYYYFDGWYDGEKKVSEKADFEFPIDRTVTLVARFLPIEYDLTVGSNIGEGVEEKNEKHVRGDKITLVAKDVEGYEFVGWKIGDKLLSDEKEYEFTMRGENVGIVAFYGKIVSLVLECDEGAGSVSGGVIGGVGGKTVRITATPRDGYVFFGWMLADALISTDAEFDYVLTNENVTLFALFGKGEFPEAVIGEKYYRVKIEAGENGKVMSGADEIIVPSSEVEIKAVPDKGYRVEKWTIDGISQDESGETLSRAFNRDSKIGVSFVKIEYKLVLTGDENIRIDGETERIFTYGDEISVSAFIVSEGYTFEGWYLGEVSQSRLPDYTFRAPANDLVLYAKSKGNEYYMEIDGNSLGYVISFVTFTSQTIAPVKTPGAAYPVPEAPTGKIFTGWYLDVGLTERYDPEKQWSKDLTLYAGWADVRPGAVNYSKGTVACGTFVDFENATGLIAYVSVFGGKTEFFARNMFGASVDAYLFDGNGVRVAADLNGGEARVAYETEAGKVYYFLPFARAGVVNAEIEIVGSPLPYLTVSKRVTFGEKYSLNPSSKTGYDFVGFFTEPGCGGLRLTDENGDSILPYGVAGNVTVYPGFTPTVYTLSLDYGEEYSFEKGLEGNYYETTEVTFDAAYALPVPDIDRYTFGGWRLGGMLLEESGVWTIDAYNPVLTAVWHRVTVTDVKFDWDKEEMATLSGSQANAALFGFSVEKTDGDKIIYGNDGHPEANFYKVFPKISSSVEGKNPFFAKIVYEISDIESTGIGPQAELTDNEFDYQAYVKALSGDYSLIPLISARNSGAFRFTMTVFDYDGYSVFTTDGTVVVYTHELTVVTILNANDGLLKSVDESRINDESIRNLYTEIKLELGPATAKLQDKFTYTFDRNDCGVAIMEIDENGEMISAGLLKGNSFETEYRIRIVATKSGDVEFRVKGDSTAFSNGIVLHVPKPIRTATELNAIRNDTEGYYILEDDIDISCYPEWKPIGYYEKDDRTSANAFKGYFDGNGHAVSGMRINVDFENNAAVGFFGVIETTAIVKNFTLTDYMITGKYENNGYGEWLGGLAGVVYGKVSDCKVTGGYIDVGGKVARHIGGAVGELGGSFVSENGKIEASAVVIVNADADTTVSEYAIGGAVGRFESGELSPISMTESVVKVIGKAGLFSVGGLLGSTNAAIKNSSIGRAEIFVSNAVSVKVGGAVGNASGCNLSEIKVEGSVRVNAGSEVYIGGVAGIAASIKNASFVGVIDSDLDNASAYVGGVAGSSGAVTGGAFAGEMIFLDENGKIGANSLKTGFISGALGGDAKDNFVYANGGSVPESVLAFVRGGDYSGKRANYGGSVKLSSDGSIEFGGIAATVNGNLDGYDFKYDSFDISAEKGVTAGGLAASVYVVSNSSAEIDAYSVSSGSGKVKVGSVAATARSVIDCVVGKSVGKAGEETYVPFESVVLSASEIEFGGIAAEIGSEMTGCRFGAVNVYLSGKKSVNYGGLVASGGGSLSNDEVFVGKAKLKADKVYYGGAAGKSDVNVSAIKLETAEAEITASEEVYYGQVAASARNISNVELKNLVPEIKPADGEMIKSLVFGHVAGSATGTVEGFNLEYGGVVVRAKSLKYGGIVGGGSARIVDCYYRGDITALDFESASVGGIAGEAGSVVNCGGKSGGFAAFDGTIHVSGGADKTSAYAGLVVGKSNSVTNCTAKGSVIAAGLTTAYAGGIVGYSGSVGYVRFEGSVSVVADMIYAGGAVGEATSVGNSSVVAKIEVDDHDGESTAEAFVGGIVGSGVTVTDSDFVGYVTASGNAPRDGYYLGGIAGYGATATRVTSDAEIEVRLVCEKRESPASVFVGGIVGKSLALVSNASATGKIAVDTGRNVYAGGVAGQADSIVSTLAQVAVAVDQTGELAVNGKTVYVGGLTGLNRPSFYRSGFKGSDEDMLLAFAREKLSQEATRRNKGKFTYTFEKDASYVKNSAAYGDVTVTGDASTVYAGGAAGFVGNENKSVTFDKESTTERVSFKDTGKNITVSMTVNAKIHLYWRSVYASFGNVTVTGKGADGQTSAVGGLIGKATDALSSDSSGASYITDCYAQNFVSVIASGTRSAVGGFVGSSSYDISHSYVQSAKNGKIRVEGDAGKYDVNVDRTQNGIENYVGGFIGENSGTVEYAYTYSTINAKAKKQGGFVGYNYGTVRQSISFASMTGAYGQDVGAFAGYSSSQLNACYAMIENAESGTLKDYSSAADYTGGVKFGGRNDFLSVTFTIDLDRTHWQIVPNVFPELVSDSSVWESVSVKLDETRGGVFRALKDIADSDLQHNYYDEREGVYGLFGTNKYYAVDMAVGGELGSVLYVPKTRSAFTENGGVLYIPERPGYAFKGRIHLDDFVRFAKGQTVNSDEWEALEYEITVEIGEGRGGTVTIDGEEVSSRVVTVEDTLELVAIGADGYVFIGYRINGLLYEANADGYPFNLLSYYEESGNLPQDLTLTAVFYKTYEFRLVYEPAKLGLAPATDMRVPFRTYVVEAEAAYGEYEFVGWYADGELVGTNPEYSFVMPTSAFTLVAKYGVPADFEVRASDENAGTVFAEEAETGKRFIGDGVKLSATPADGYAFVCWTDENGAVAGKNAEFTFVIERSCVITAQFRKKFALGITYTDGVTVKTVDDVYEGKTVEIEATVEKGYFFVGWFERVSVGGVYEYVKICGETTYSFVAAGDRRIEARAALIRSVTVTFDGECGTVTPEDKKFSYDGEKFTLTAVPAAGYAFVGWFGADGEKLCDGETFEIECDGKDVVLTATFGKTYAVTAKVAEDDEKGGILSVSKARACVGETVTFTANVYPGFGFIGWYNGENLVSEETECQALIDGDLTLTAKFKRLVYSVVISSDTDGYEVVCDGNKTTGVYGDEIAVRADAARRDTHVFAGWRTKDGELVSEKLEYTFKLTGDTVLVAVYYEYKKVSYEIMFVSGTDDNGEPIREETDVCGSVVCSIDGKEIAGSVADGKAYRTQKVKMEAKPEDGYEFVGWFLSNGMIVYKRVLEVVVSDFDIKAEARFVASKLTVEVECDREGLTVSGGGTNLAYGEKILLTAEENADYKFLGWFVGGETDGVLLSEEYEYMHKVTANVTVVARYRKYYSLSHGETEIVFTDGEKVVERAYEGETVTARVVAENGEKVVELEMNDEKLGSKADYTFAMPACDVHFVATKRTLRKVEIIADDGSCAVKLDKNEFYDGLTVRATAEIDENYKFLGWFVGGEQVGKYYDYEFTVDGEDVSVEARTARFRSVVAKSCEGAEVTFDKNEFYDGLTVTAKITVDPAFKLTEFKKNGVDVDEREFTFVVGGGDVTFTAKTARLRSVTVVTADGVEEAAFDAKEFYDGLTVGLTVSVGSDYKYLGLYEGGKLVSSEAVYEFEVDRDLTFEVRTAKYYAVTVETDCAFEGFGRVDYPERAYEGETVELTAESNDGFEFIGWLDGDAFVKNDGEPYTFVMRGRDVSIVAKFGKYRTVDVKFVLDADYADDCGTVYYLGDDDVYTAVLPERIYDGKLVTLKIKPFAAYRFEGWYVDDALTETNVVYTFGMPAGETPYEIVLRFTKPDYTLRFVAESGGKIDVEGEVLTEGSVTLKYEGKIELAAVLNEGHAFIGWFASGVMISSEEKFVYSPKTFALGGNRTELPADRTIFARFGVYADNVVGTITDGGADGSGAGSGGSGGSGETGGEISLVDETGKATESGKLFVGERYTANVTSVADGFVFVGWYTVTSGGTRTFVCSEKEYSFALEAGKNVMARFAKPVSLSVGADAELGNVFAVVDGVAYRVYSRFVLNCFVGDEIKLYAYAKDSKFGEWLFEGGESKMDEEISFTLGGDVTISAVFHKNRTLTYHAEYADKNAETAIKKNIATEVVYDTQKYVLSHGTADRVGYEFVGMLVNGEKPDDNADGEITISGDVEITLLYSRIYYVVTVSASVEGAKVGSDKTEAGCGERVTISAKELEGYYFDGWWRGDEKVSDAGVYGFVQDDENSAFVAKYLKYYTISVVVADPRVVLKTENEFSAYDSSTVTLELESVDAGFTPVWYDSDYNVLFEGDTSISVRVDGATAVDGVITFFVMSNPIDYSLTLEAEGYSAGLKYSFGGDELDYLGSVTFNLETQKRLHVVAPENSDYRFEGWYLNGVPVSTEYSYTVDHLIAADMKFVAKYTRVYELKVIEVVGGVSGQAKSSKHAAGDEVTLEATLKAGYTFVGFTSDSLGECKSINYLFTMPGGAVEIFVGYRKTDEYFVVKANYSDEIEIGMTGDTSVVGNAITLTAPEVSGYRFVGWFVGGTSVRETAVYEVELAKLNIEARYEKAVTLTVIAGENSFTVGGYENEVVIVSDYTPKGYVFVGYKKDGSDTTYYPEEFTLDTETKVLTLVLKPIEYKITVSGEHNIGATASKNTFAVGEEIVFETGDFDQNAYRFDGWYINGAEEAASKELTFSMTMSDAADVSVVAKFSKKIKFGYVVKKADGTEITGEKDAFEGDLVGLKALISELVPDYDVKKCNNVRDENGKLMLNYLKDDEVFGDTDLKLVITLQ